jgi:histone H3/H4
MTEPDTWHVCSICRTAILFDQTYYACSVSTCNRKRTALYFCSVACWEAHVPMMRHREAWAEENRSPSRAVHQRQQREREEAASRRTADAAARTSEAVAAVGAPVVGDEPLPQDVLVVVSKLKRYIKARSGMNTSDHVVGVLSDHLRALCTEAIREAARDGRRTVMNRDFSRVLSDLRQR